MSMTKVEAATHKYIWKMLGEQGYGTYAKIFSKLDLHLTKNPNVVGYMTPKDGTITVNDQLDQDQVSVIIRHEILHNYLLHEKRLLDHLAKKHGIDPDDLDDIKVKDLKQELYKNKNFNIAGDYEISNLGYTDDDKYAVRHIKLNGQELCGLVTEDQHPEWLDYSVEQMYDALTGEMEKEKDDMEDDIQNQDSGSEGESGDSEGDSEGGGGQGQSQSGDEGDREGSGEGSGMQQGNQQSQSGQSGQSGEQSGEQSGQGNGSDSGQQQSNQKGSGSGSGSVDETVDRVTDDINKAVESESYGKENKTAQKNKAKAVADMKKAMSKLSEEEQEEVRKTITEAVNSDPELKKALEDNPGLAKEINDALGGDVAGKKAPQIGDHPEDEESKRIEDEEAKNREENDVTNRTEEEEKARLEEVKDLLNDEDAAEQAQAESTSKVQKDRIRRHEKEVKKELDKYKNTHGIEAFTISLKRFIAKETKEIRVGTYSKLNKTYNTNTGSIIKRGHKNKPNGHIPKINVYYDQSGSWNASDIEIADNAIGVLKKDYVDKGLIKIDIYYFANHVHTDAQTARDEGGTGAGAEVIQHIKDTKADNVIIFTDNDFDGWGVPNDSVTVPGAVYFLWRGGARAYQYREHVKGRRLNEQFDIKA